MGFLFFIVAVVVAAGGGGDSTITGKRLGLKVRPMPPRLDVLPLEPPEDSQWTATMVRELGCKDFTWGFCVDDVMTTALEAGGAKAVDRIINWISWFTGIELITRVLCMRITWKLRAYETSVAALMYGIEDPWADSRQDLSSSKHPAAKIEGFERAWISEASLHSGDTKAWWFHLPDRGISMLLADTSTIRRALQRDKLDLSQLSGAQCADGSWKLLGRGEAMKNFG